MPQHYAHYLTRKIIAYDRDRWTELASLPPDQRREWFDIVQAEDGGFDKPAAHITGSMGWPAKEIAENDVIWLFACVVYKKRRLSIGLDAKIVVERIEELDIDGKRKLKFYAGNGSSWVPLANWTPQLLHARIVLKNEKYCRLPLPKQTFGQSMQGFRKLSSTTAINFEKYLENVCKPGAFDFISYRHKDGTEKAVTLVQKLLAEGRVIWWDRWSLPRRLAEGREALAERSLEREIFDQITAAQTVHGVMSDGYQEEGAFTLRERASAGDRFRFAAV